MTSVRALSGNSAEKSDRKVQINQHADQSYRTGKSTTIKKRTLAEEIFVFLFERRFHKFWNSKLSNHLNHWKIFNLTEEPAPCVRTERIRPERAHRPNVYGWIREKRKRREKWVKKRASKKLIKRLPLLFVRDGIRSWLFWLSASSRLALVWSSAGSPTGHYDQSVGESEPCVQTVWPGVSSEKAVARKRRELAIRSSCIGRACASAVW